MLTGEHGTEQREIRPVDGMEAAVATAVVCGWPAQGIERGDAFALKWGCCERVQVAVVGGDADLEVAPQITDPFYASDTTAARADPSRGW